MSNNKSNIGDKIMEDGWIDFQNNPQWRKPMLDLDCGGETTFKTSNIKELLKGFINVDITYMFQGLKINPEVSEELSKLKKVNGAITRFKRNDDLNYQLRISKSLVNTYITSLKQGLTENNVPYINYELAEQDHMSYFPGFLSWPTIFVIPHSKRSVLINEVISLNSQYDRIKQIESPQFYNMIEIDAIRNANIKPLLFDEDTSFEVKGDLVQKMSNLIMPYRAKHKISSFDY